MRNEVSRFRVEDGKIIYESNDEFKQRIQRSIALVKPVISCLRCNLIFRSKEEQYKHTYEKHDKPGSDEETSSSEVRVTNDEETLSSGGSENNMRFAYGEKTEISSNDGILETKQANCMELECECDKFKDVYVFDSKKIGLGVCQVYETWIHSLVSLHLPEKGEMEEFNGRQSEDKDPFIGKPRPCSPSEVSLEALPDLPMSTNSLCNEEFTQHHQADMLWNTDIDFYSNVEKSRDNPCAGLANTGVNYEFLMGPRVKSPSFHPEPDVLVNETDFVIPSDSAELCTDMPMLEVQVPDYSQTEERLNCSNLSTSMVSSHSSNFSCAEEELCSEAGAPRLETEDEDSCSESEQNSSLCSDQESLTESEKQKRKRGNDDDDYDEKRSGSVKKVRLLWCKICDTYYKDLPTLKLHVKEKHSINPSRINRYNVCTWDLEIGQTFSPPESPSASSVEIEIDTLGTDLENTNFV